MYYAVFDKQAGNYLETGKNSKTKKDVKKDILSMMYWDIEEDDRKTYERMPLEEILDMVEMLLEKSNVLFK